MNNALDGRTKYQLTLLAKIAQQTQRYEEMITYADRLFVFEEQLTSAERNLCASAYKNIISNKRAQLKVLYSLKDKLNTKQSKDMLIAIKKYRNKIQQELKGLCLKVIKIIEEQVIPAKIQIKSVQAKVFYLKIRADFYRYLCQIDDDESFIQLASQYYEQADTLARSNLPPTNEVRVSLHLNMSVFLYERCDEREKAIDLANRAFDEAVSNVNQTNQESFKNCTMILQLIRDNINLWNGDEDA